MTSAAGMRRRRSKKPFSSDEFAHRLIVDHGIVTRCQQLHEIWVQNCSAFTIEGGLGVTLTNRPVSGTSRECSRTKYGVSRNADYSNVTPSRKPLRHTTRHGRLNPSSGMTNANLTGIAPVLATSSADPVADKSRTTQSIFSRSYSILAGFATRKRGEFGSPPSISRQ